MDFRTIINHSKSSISVNYNSRILSFGSCFAETIGSQLRELKFDIDVNPFGIIYNPISIANSLQMLIDDKKFGEDDIFFNNDIWSSLYHHSSFSAIDKDECLQKINSRIEIASYNIKNCDVLLITFGTSWIYRHNKINVVVSNCHKLPAPLFSRHRTGVNEIVESYSILINKLKSINSNLKILFSVSPIRHIKDGLHQNQLSKSTLLLAIDELEKQFDFVEYFPSYEILMDDLRDYRFYEHDMLHPGKPAIDYIWEQFVNLFFSKPTLELCNQIRKIIQAKSHRPFNNNTGSHKLFLQSYFEKTELLRKQFPHLNFKEELKYFGMYKFL
jgi:hypothetical protein